MDQRRAAILFLYFCYLLATGLSAYRSHGPPEDGLDWIDNTIVPEPSVPGGSWWYTPSRKAHLYAGKYRSLIEYAKTKSVVAQEDHRLPNNLVPTVYSIRLLPFLEEGNFTTDGFIQIFVNCTKSTRDIVLNAAELVIKEDSIQVYDLAAQTVVSSELIDEQSTKETITIRTAEELQAGNRYRVNINFISILNDENRGFYRASYVENGVKKWMAISDFEAPNARRAFPCFDEPNIKAQFSVTLGRKTSMRAASNMPLRSSNPIDGMPGYVWDFFDTTLTMSTYIVAFMVADFEAVPATPGLGRVPFRIWTRPSYVNQTNYALDKAPRIQKHFEDYFEIPYSFPKQDLVGVPQFAWGAMENWGLITYRENYLLLDPATASRTAYQGVASVNAHELAHQWFGNYVTLNWWNVLWLNEGFATYYEHVGTAVVEADWRMDEQALTTDMHYVFGVDALQTSRPMNIPVVTTDDMDVMFDAISYEKGGCIVRMMNDIFGEESFRKALTRYLNANAYGNADESNLWAALQQQAALDRLPLPGTVKDVMETWTMQMGYPLINVTRNYDSNTAVVSQERFLLRKTEGMNDTHVYRWWVPLTYKHRGSPLRKTEWLSTSDISKTINIADANNDEWVLFNVDQQNYYRVVYDEMNYALLTNQLMTSHMAISNKNRAQLLDDVFNIALANLIPYKWALDVSVYLEHERDYVPWRAVLTELDYIDIRLRGSSAFSSWKNYMIKLIRPYYNYVGFEEKETDAHLTIYSRTDALNWACRLEIPDCVNNALARYKELMEQPNLVLSPNQRLIILRTGVESGKRSEYNFAFDRYKATGDTAYLEAMTCTKLIDAIYEMLEMMLQPASGIRRSDVNTLFTNLAASPVGNSLAFNFLINRWDDIAASLGNGYFVSFYYSLRNRLNTQSDLSRYIKLRDDHMDILGNSNSVQLAIETVENNLKWMTLHLEEISQWLKGIENPTTIPVSTTTTQVSTASSTASTTTTFTSTTTIPASTGSTASAYTSPTTTSTSTTMLMTSRTTPTTAVTPTATVTDSTPGTSTMITSTIASTTTGSCSSIRPLFLTTIFLAFLAFGLTR